MKRETKSRCATGSRAGGTSADIVAYVETARTDIRRSLDSGEIDAAEADRRVSVLMGDKVQPRREYIAAYANFNRKDSFMDHVETEEKH